MHTTLLKKHWALLLLALTWIFFAISLRDLPSEPAAKSVSARAVSAMKTIETESRLNDEARRQRLAEIKPYADWETVLSQAWRRWIAKAAVLVLGIASLVLAWRRTQGWTLGLLFASAAYLLLVNSFPLIKAQNPDQWRAWWIMAHFAPFASTLYTELFFPLVHVFVVMTVLIILTREFAKRYPT